MNAGSPGQRRSHTCMIRLPAPRLATPPLLTQILCVNAALICATVLASSVVLRLDAHAGDADAPRSLVLIAAVLATVLVNGLVLRRRFEPLTLVIDAMEAVDFTSGSPHPSLRAPDSAEVVRLQSAFTRMLRRLEAESSRTASAVQEAQEAERARLARDLHDEANQALTGVLLRLEATMHHAPPDLRAELRETREVAARAMEELLRPAHRARAGARQRRRARSRRAARGLPRRPGGAVERRAARTRLDGLRRPGPRGRRHGRAHLRRRRRLRCHPPVARPRPH